MKREIHNALIGLAVLAVLIWGIMMLSSEQQTKALAQALALQDCRDSLSVAQAELRECVKFSREHLEECSWISKSQIKKQKGIYLTLYNVYEDHE